MTSFLASKKVYLIVRVLLGVLFIVSGTIKAFDPDAFAGVIQAFSILPVELSFPAAVIITYAEIILGIGLVADVKGSLSGILVLVLGFMAVLGWALYMGYDIDCGCFGPQDPEAKVFSSLKSSLFRDVGLAIAILYLYIWRFKNGYSPISILRFRKQEAEI